jgi:hypothetical protein
VPLREKHLDPASDLADSQGLEVFFVSSVLVTVPSDDWVTVFSFVLTEPSLFAVVVSVLEISRSQPTVRKDNVSADIAAKATRL